VLRKIFSPKEEEVAGERRELHTEELLIFDLHQILFESSNQEE
jgi:hypothetical protein